MSNDLKPCPFCGGKANRRIVDGWERICCTNVSCQTTGGRHVGEQDAIAAWNRRAPDLTPSPAVTGRPFYPRTVPLEGEKK